MEVIFVGTIQLVRCESLSDIKARNNNWCKEVQNKVKVGAVIIAGKK